MVGADKNINRSDYGDKTDLELIELVISHNDHIAFEVLIKRYWRLLYFQADSYMKDKSKSEDILQEAVIKIYQNIGQLKDKSKFTSWSTAIVRYQSINYLKSEKKELTAKQKYAQFQMTEQLTKPDHDDIRNQLDKKMQHDRFMNIISILPAPDREILLLSFEYQLNIHEMAEKLNISVNTAEMRLYRARKKLKKIISGESI